MQVLFGSLFDSHALDAKKAATAVGMLATQKRGFKLLNTAIASFKLVPVGHQQRVMSLLKTGSWLIKTAKEQGQNTKLYREGSIAAWNFRSRRCWQTLRMTN